MAFDSIIFWSFFVIVLILTLTLPARHSRLLLVIASFSFYSFWDVRFLALLAVSIFLNFFLGLRIDSSSGETRRFWLISSISLNLLILGFFKYYNFFAVSFDALFGLSEHSLFLGIILPVGVSFFTFEGIAYSVDVYKRDVAARTSLVDFALFISFFPHLVAGPIIRPHDFFPQFRTTVQISEADFKWSMLQIIKGLIKKCIFADTFALYANDYFSGTNQIPALIGVLAFAFQIYFDFAGYTDIARGCAQLLGFRFPPNFERPYLATDISDFWRRWHISLSTWLRDYLYIPLGGNRSSRFNTYRNYIFVMSLGGLWHGASWNFLAWGLYHGILLAIHRAYREISPTQLLRYADLPAGRMVSFILTFTLVTIGWIPFRANSWSSTLRIFEELLNSSAYSLRSIDATYITLLVIPIIYCLADQKRFLEGWMTRDKNTPAFIVAAGTGIWLIELFAYRDSAVPFIYFQF